MIKDVTVVKRHEYIVDGYFERWIKKRMKKIKRVVHHLPEPPMPCKVRKAINWLSVLEKPHPIENARNRPWDMSQALRRPMMSDKRATTTPQLHSARVYASAIQFTDKKTP